MLLSASAEALVMRTATGPCSDGNRTAVYLRNDDVLTRLTFEVWRRKICAVKERQLSSSTGGKCWLSAMRHDGRGRGRLFAANRDLHWRAVTGAKMGASSSQLVLRRKGDLLWVIMS